MYRPLFARGRLEEHALAQPAPAGTRTFCLAHPAGSFASGDRLFIEDANGAAPEFLGPVVSLGASTLTTVFPSRVPRAAEARIWKPAQSCQWPSEPTLPLKREYSTGIVNSRSVGGVLFSTRVAEPLRIDRLELRQCPVGEFHALRAWFAAATDNGLLDFTYVDERRGVSRARLYSPAFIMEQHDELTIDVALEIAVLAEGECAR